MVFGHGVWNDVFNYENNDDDLPPPHTIASIQADYSNCLISYYLAYQRLRDLPGGNSDNEATDILNEVATPDCFDEGEDPVYGCTDPNANNYDPEATMEAIYNECRYDGCTDRDATNYDPRATDDDDSCIFPVLGCTDPTANNYNENADEDDDSCTYTTYGCTDSAANNYNENADEDDGSCTYDAGTIPGCMDETANNYNAEATTDNGTCTYDVVGCMDETACNYDEDANVDSEECKYGDECGALDGLEDWHLIAGAILLVVLLK